ncbi:hypothetical protein [Roseicella sp. DB1501]|uniref:hypothetical protein n=1 Tax=Roseicella sp. DB1501 TaxID=2730925 RepID=UPI0014919E70|nr:hypothetical protein [Roseicella sp. DB1501]NOG70503.1 hypothetical protein [Roseicella sp. DB1501]
MKKLSLLLAFCLLTLFSNEAQAFNFHMNFGFNSRQAPTTAAFIPANNAIVAKGGYTSVHPNNSGYMQTARRSVIVVGRQPVKSIRLIYWNGYLNHGEFSNANPITIEAALEQISPTAKYVTVTFNAAANVTIPSGQWAVSDPIYPAAFGLNVFPAGWGSNFSAAVRTGMTLSSTSDKWASAEPNFQEIFNNQNNGTTRWISTALVPSQIQAAGPFTTPGTASNSYGDFAMMPSAIIGEWAGTPDVSLFLSGDSINYGYYDNQDNGSLGGGYVVNGIRNVNGGQIPFVHVAKPSEAASDWPVGGAVYRKWLMQFATHYQDDYGTNDFQANKTAAQTLAAKQVIWADFRQYGKYPRHIANDNVIPRATSTNNWSAPTDQTPVASSVVGGPRDQLNASITPLIGQSNGPDEVFDINSYCRDPNASYSDRWVSNGTSKYGTPDGTHPSATIHSLASSPYTTMAAGWTVGVPANDNGASSTSITADSILLTADKQ